jgi:hypothetical protein
VSTCGKDVKMSRLITERRRGLKGTRTTRGERGSYQAHGGLLVVPLIGATI